MVKIVKALSIALGALIVGSLGLLLYGLFYKTQSGNLFKTQQEAPQAEKPLLENPVAGVVDPSVPPVGDFGAIGLGQPAGSSVAQVTAQGALVYLTVRDGGLSDRVLVVDLVRRRVIGRIDVGDADARPPRPAK